MGLLSAEELFVVVDIAVAVVVHLHAVVATAVVHGIKRFLSLSFVSAAKGTTTLSMATLSTSIKTFDIQHNDTEHLVLLCSVACFYYCAECR